MALDRYEDCIEMQGGYVEDADLHGPVRLQ
jgi:hypothetical protein